MDDLDFTILPLDIVKVFDDNGEPLSDIQKIMLVGYLASTQSAIMDIGLASVIKNTVKGAVKTGFK